MALRVAVMTAVVALGGGLVAAQTRAPILDNYYAAAETVTLPAPVVGDAVVAGRVVTVAEPVSGDVLAAGWRIRLNAHADDDVRAAGAEVEITAPVGGDLTAAAGDLTVGPNVHVGGRTWLTGRTVRMLGVFERETRVAAEHVTIGGEVRQPIRIIAQRLDILPSARVLGPLTYEGATPAAIAAGAYVAKPITYRNIPASDVREARWPRGVSSMVFGTHVFFGGLLLLLLLPRLASRPAAVLREQPGQSLLIGLAVLVTIPAVALMLIISLVGLPVGFALAALYAAALFAGVVITALFVGDFEGRLFEFTPPSTLAGRAVWLLAGVVTLAVLSSVPVLGTLIVFAAVVFGLGALAVWLYRTYLQAPPLLTPAAHQS